MSGPHRVLLVGGDRHGRSTLVPEFSLADPIGDGYREADYFHLPDPDRVWSESPMPRVAVSFAGSEGFPTFAEICAMKTPKVPDEMHARLQDAWSAQLSRRRNGGTG